MYEEIGLARGSAPSHTRISLLYGTRHAAPPTDMRQGACSHLVTYSGLHRYVAFFRLFLK